MMHKNNKPSRSSGFILLDRIIIYQFDFRNEAKVIYNIIYLFDGFICQPLHLHNDNYNGYLRCKGMHAPHTLILATRLYRNK